MDATAVADSRSRCVITGPLPAEVRAVLAQRLFVEKAGLPSPLLNQIKRLAAFQNPEFYKKQSMRLSTAMTPRVIACAEDLPQHVALPARLPARARGTAARATASRSTSRTSAYAGAAARRCASTGSSRRCRSRPRARCSRTTCGVFVAPPGIGKTVVGTYLVAARALQHARPGPPPAAPRPVARPARRCSSASSRRRSARSARARRPANGRLDVAMIQSLVRKDQVADLVAGYGQVIVDECHHLPAVSFERVLAEVKARYVVGLTATPQRRDGHHPITEMQLGRCASR